MKFKITCSPQTRGSVTKKFISSSLALGLLFNTTLPSLASTLSEDGRYESFEGSNITIDNVLEEDKVDVEIEGNTMVNVANQKDPVPITKSYAVEGTNHIPLQGEYDGKARPVIEGNTLVNLLDLTYDDKEPTPDNPAYKSSEKREVGWDWSVGQVYNNWVSVNYDLELVQPNKTYSIIFNVKENNPTLNGNKVSLESNLRLDAKGCQHKYFSLKNVSVGVNVRSFTTVEDSLSTETKISLYTHSKSSTGDSLVDNGQLIIGDIMLLEGDWTNKELPKYFEGVKSSFEDQLVTQDMVDTGQEKAENLGKYKVEYKVTGKNKIGDLNNWQNLGDSIITSSSSVIINATSWGKGIKQVFKLSPGEYTLSAEIANNVNISIKKMNGFGIKASLGTFVTDDGMFTIEINNKSQTGECIVSNLQLEEGSVITEYEPYRESTKTFYLNSPLLEGDTIEDIDSKATHVKRYGKVILDGSTIKGIYDSYRADGYTAILTKKFDNHTNSEGQRSYKIFCDALPTRGNVAVGLWDKSVLMEGISFVNESWGFCVKLSNQKTGVTTDDALETIKEKFTSYLNANPLTVVYLKATPTYETISEESILIDSYKDGHLDLNSNIPVNKVDFIPTSTELNYLYPSIEYTVQFESDNIGKIDTALLGEGVLYNDYLVNKGINRFNITTPNETLSTELILNGIGFNLSNLVVTEATNESFDYFKEITSVGQDDVNDYNIKVISNNKNLFDITKYPFQQGMTYHYLYGYEMLERSNVVTADMIPVRPNTQYKYHCFIEDVSVLQEVSIFYFDSDKKYIGRFVEARDDNHYITTPNNAKYISITIMSNNDTYLSGDKVFLTYGRSFYDGSYTGYQSNSIQIPLSEPLRSLPNGVRDKIIKKNGQWVVERNLKEVVLDGSVDEIWNIAGTTADGLKWFNLEMTNAKYASDGEVISNKFNYIKEGVHVRKDECIGITANQNIGTVLRIVINPIRYSNLVSFTEWLSENPTTVVYQLAEPIYEPLNVEPTIDLYLDTTHISNNSNIPANMKVTVDRTMNKAVEAIELAQNNPTIENLSNARYWTNLLRESTKKDELQSGITDIEGPIDIELERKDASANLDVYIKSENMLSLSLDTNSVSFDNYSGVSSMEIKDAVGITISSSLPYSLNAYMPNEITSSDGLKTMPIYVLNIKEGSKDDYQTFTDTTNKVVLKEDCAKGNGINHSVDLKLDSNNAHEADIYKTVIKFEAEQK